MKGVSLSWDSSGVAEEGNERHVTPQWLRSIQLFIIFIVFYLMMLSVAQNIWCLVSLLNAFLILTIYPLDTLSFLWGVCHSLSHLCACHTASAIHLIFIIFVVDVGLLLY